MPGFFDDSWFWSMCQFFVLLCTLIIVVRQLGIQRQANMLATLEAMRRNWKSDTFESARKVVCQGFLKNNVKIDKSEEIVLGFFEDMAIYWEKKVLTIDLLWEMYSYYIEHYGAMLRKNIKEIRNQKKDKTFFSNFDKLYRSICEYSKKKGAYPGKTQDELELFANSEIMGR